MNAWKWSVQILNFKPMPDAPDKRIGAKRTLAYCVWMQVRVLGSIALTSICRTLAPNGWKLSDAFGVNPQSGRIHTKRSPFVRSEWRVGASLPHQSEREASFQLSHRKRKFGSLNYEKTSFWGRLLYSVSITNILCEEFDAHRKIYDTHKICRWCFLCAVSFGTAAIRYRLAVIAI